MIMIIKIIALINVKEENVVNLLVLMMIKENAIKPPCFDDKCKRKKMKGPCGPWGMPPCGKKGWPMFKPECWGMPPKECDMEKMKCGKRGFPPMWGMPPCKPKCRPPCPPMWGMPKCKPKCRPPCPPMWGMPPCKDMWGMKKKCRPPCPPMWGMPPCKDHVECLE